MENFLSELPEKKILVQWFRENGSGIIPDVNSHIHSPYSFSAFKDLHQAFVLASQENVRVLGINDFNTSEGYPEFYDLSLRYRIFPLFNIEFMGLMKDEQGKGIRINDPNNPGRIYFSGKGLDFPVNKKSGVFDKVNIITEESHNQVRAMIEKLNEHLDRLDSSLKLDFAEIQRKYAMNMVRERHVAQALRIMIFENFNTPAERKDFLKRLYGNRDPLADLNNSAAVENEFRSRLLKSGGLAFVEEAPGAFMDIKEIMSIIKNAGGIPCYPVLLDDTKGHFTEFESDMEKLFLKLESINVSCIELIPTRNDLKELGRFVNYFNKKGFVILFGTEHNTPSPEPMKVFARGAVPLDDGLRTTAYNGACVIAAHQYLRARGEEGYIFLSGTDRERKRAEFEELGKAVIERFLN